MDMSLFSEEMELPEFFWGVNSFSGNSKFNKYGGHVNEPNPHQIIFTTRFYLVNTLYSTVTSFRTQGRLVKQLQGNSAKLFE